MVRPIRTKDERRGPLSLSIVVKHPVRFSRENPRGRGREIPHGKEIVRVTPRRWDEYRAWMGARSFLREEFRIFNGEAP